MVSTTSVHGELINKHEIHVDVGCISHTCFVMSGGEVAYLAVCTSV